MRELEEYELREMTEFKTTRALRFNEMAADAERSAYVVGMPAHEAEMLIAQGDPRGRERLAEVRPELEAEAERLALISARNHVDAVRAGEAKCSHGLYSGGGGLNDARCLICGRRGQWGRSSTDGHAMIAW